MSPSLLDIKKNNPSLLKVGTELKLSPEGVINLEQGNSKGYHVEQIFTLISLEIDNEDSEGGSFFIVYDGESCFAIQTEANLFETPNGKER